MHFQRLFVKIALETFDLKKLGQGHGIQHSQWSLSSFFTFFIFAKVGPVFCANQNDTQQTDRPTDTESDKPTTIGESCRFD